MINEEEIIEVKKHIRDAFRKWCHDWLFKPFEKGGFGYDRLSGKQGNRNGISAFLGPEADVQMHFGAYLFNHLASIGGKDQPLKYSVHAEEKVFEYGRARADLIVTKVTSATRLTQEDVWTNVLAIIEIKGQAFFNAYKASDFNNLVGRDFAKLIALKPQIAANKVGKFVLVYHEKFEDNQKFEQKFVRDQKFEEVEFLIPFVSAADKI